MLSEALFRKENNKNDMGNGGDKILSVKNCALYQFLVVSDLERRARGSTQSAITINNLILGSLTQRISLNNKKLAHNTLC